MIALCYDCGFLGNMNGDNQGWLWWGTGILLPSQGRTHPGSPPLAPRLSLITSPGWWVKSAPRHWPVSSPVGKKPPGDLSGSEAAGVDTRKAGQLHLHSSSSDPIQTREMPTRRKWLKHRISRLQEKPSSASLFVVSKHFIRSKLTFL